MSIESALTEVRRLPDGFTGGLESAVLVNKKIVVWMYKNTEVNAKKAKALKILKRDNNLNLKKAFASVRCIIYCQTHLCSK